jgi:hypothetical protein
MRKKNIVRGFCEFCGIPSGGLCEFREFCGIPSGGLCEFREFCGIPSGEYLRNMPAVLITGKQHSLTLARLALVRDFRGGSNISVGPRLGRLCCFFIHYFA